MMSSKNIWIISYFAGGPSYCPRIPDYSLAKYLNTKGYRVKIFAGSSIHNTSNNFINDKKIYLEKIVDGVPFVFLNTRNYISKIGEVLSFIDFYLNLRKIYNKFEQPDIIISAMPQPLACLIGYQIAKKYNIPYITSIVDLWPLSIVEYAGFSDFNPVIKLMYLFEKWIYIKSDELVFTWEGAYDYIKDKKWEKYISKDKTHYINIGVSLENFYKNQIKYIVKDNDLNTNSFKVMYCGSIRTANDIKTIVECANQLCKDGYEKDIEFFIYGEGPDKEILIDKCQKENITNVKFKGFVDKKYIPYILSKSDLNILNLLPAATQKYGNSSNKLFEYMAAGNPVIANIDEGKYPIISKYKCGKIVKSGYINDYVEGIKYFYHLSNDEKMKYTKNSLEAVKDYDDIVLNEKWRKIISKYIG